MGNRVLHVISIEYRAIPRLFYLGSTTENTRAYIERQAGTAISILRYESVHGCLVHL